MKKKYIVIVAILILIIVIILVIFGNKPKTEDKIMPESDLKVNDSSLISEDKTVDKIVFQNCKIVTLNGKTMLKVELKNNFEEIYIAKSIRFQLLNENNNILAEQTRRNIIIAKNNKLLVELEFDKVYDNVYNVQYIIE